MKRLKRISLILSLVLLLMPLISCVSRQRDEKEKPLNPPNPNLNFPAFPVLPENAYLYDKEYDLWAVPGSYLKELAEYETLISAEEDKYVLWEETYGK